MPLDPQAKAYLDQLAAVGAPSLAELPVEEARRLFRERRSLAGPPEEVGKVEDRTIAGGIPVRVYTPIGDIEGPRPALMFFHGGGWTIGDLDTVDTPCRRLANGSGCVVVSVDYRRAPEHRFPAALDDAFAATGYVAAHPEEFGVDPDRLAVGGESAGGNLAAAVALRARDRGGPPIAFQMLIYPVLDSGCNTPSYREHAEGYGLTRLGMRRYWSNYLPDLVSGRDPLAAPASADDLRGLPPALVQTAEFDVLRDEAESYAARLRAAGVAAECRRYDGLIHGYFYFAGIIDRGRGAIDDAARALEMKLR
ncbi:MAG TPA: alpha/beta hydrolase [Isosphaeraceae bacterium]|jgi:acetyl esterase|nr:alpha/beta hydrolase [Isosphaeraceae bacterium]